MNDIVKNDFFTFQGSTATVAYTGEVGKFITTGVKFPTDFVHQKS